MINLTEKEREFIEAVRNYKRAYPNGYSELRYYIDTLYAELLDEQA